MKEEELLEVKAEIDGSAPRQSVSLETRQSQAFAEFVVVEPLFGAGLPTPAKRPTEGLQARVDRTDRQVSPSSLQRAWTIFRSIACARHAVALDVLV